MDMYNRGNFNRRYYLSMNILKLLALGIIAGHAAFCQSYDASRVFAHNDYEGSNPFHTSYALQVGYIEADVFLQSGKLMVAHHKHEIRDGRTLENLYLEPLSEALERNNGFAYADTTRGLTLMIDLKTEGVPTLNAIVSVLRKYPSVIASPTLQIMISGSVPDPALWQQYPAFIYFDGRPNIPYTRHQWKRISMISTNFRSHVKWDGDGTLPAGARKEIADLMAVAHQHGKKFRFWATPDFENAWRELKAINVDVIGTDRVPDLVAFLKSQ